MDCVGLPYNSLFQCDVIEYTGNSSTAGASWSIWRKPPNRSMCYIFLLGSGGCGGTGTIGAASSAAGGGGGGSSSQVILTIPMFLLPEKLFISVGMGSAAAGVASYICVAPNTTVNHILAISNGGGAGGNASGGTGGTGGTAGSVPTASTMPLGWNFASVLAGQAGTAGGTISAGTALTLPTTGLRVTGGTGGGGLPPGGSTAGGAFTAITTPTTFPVHNGGAGATGTTSPPSPGNSGYLLRDNGIYYYGGTGAGSTHGSATGAGLVQAGGGDGGFGCGGGGTGGALTGSTTARQSSGGNGLCVIISY